MSPIIVDKEKKREEILNAAWAVFAEKGFSNARMDDIAKKGDIGKGTIYEYFKNKDELFLALYGNVCKQFHEAVFGTLKERNSATEGLERYIASTFRAFDEWREFAFILLDFWSERRKGKADQSCFDEMCKDDIEWLADLIRSGIENGEFRKVDPLGTASIIIALLDGLLIQCMFNSDLFSKMKTEKRVVDLILNGIKEDTKL